MLEVDACSLIVNRPVRTRMQGGVGVGVKHRRLPDWAACHLLRLKRAGWDNPRFAQKRPVLKRAKLAPSTLEKLLHGLERDLVSECADNQRVVGV